MPTRRPLDQTTQFERHDHRCADIGMAKELLDCANVVPVFEQMRGKRMPERMATDALRDSRLSRGHRHGTLHRRLVHVISRWRSPPGVAAHPTRRKHKLPGPVRRGVRILPIERVRQHHGSDAVSQIPLVLPLYLGEMRCQWRLIEFAYITGWRIPSEVLTLQWRNVDFKPGEVRLDPGSTKNRDGRVFLFTDDLRRLLEGQYAEHLKLRKAGKVEPWAFFRMVADKRGGEKTSTTDSCVYKSVEACLHRRGLSRTNSTRPAPNGRQEHGAPRSPRTRCDATQRTQNAIGVRTLQHRPERRPSRSCYAASRADRDKEGQSGTFSPLSESESSEIAK